MTVMQSKMRCVCLCEFMCAVLCSRFVAILLRCAKLRWRLPQAQRTTQEGVLAQHYTLRMVHLCMHYMQLSSLPYARKPNLPRAHAKLMELCEANM